MNAHEKVIRTVVVIMGAIALIFAVGVLWMFWIMLVESRGKDQVDPTIVGIFGTVCTLAGSAIAALGGLLASTRSQTSAQVVAIDQPSDEPVPVAPVEVPAQDDPVVEPD